MALRFAFLKRFNPQIENLRDPTTCTNATFETINVGPGWQLHEDNGRFTAVNGTTGDSQRIMFNYTGSTDSTTATTWDFAPVDEQQEVEPDQFNNFRLRLHKDQDFLEGQIKWNRRLDRWHEATRNTGTNRNLHCTSGACTDSGETFWITSDISRFHHGELPWTARHMPYLWNIHSKGEFLIDKIDRKVRGFVKWLLPNTPGEVFEKRLKEQKSMELLEKWLEPKEITALMELGELEIHAEDVVYIVEKNPGATIRKRYKDGKEESFCIIPTSMGWASGDILLSKILMCKAIPEEMEKVAIRRS